MRALDLFCGAGGAGIGLRRAGFEVIGVDQAWQPAYPFAFTQADALNPPFNLTGFDLIWASPPCQGYSPHVSSRSSKWVPTLGKDEPRLIDDVRAMLVASGVPYVIENVSGAKSALRDPIMLCGAMFGLPLARHRYFETSFMVMAPPHGTCRGVAKAFAARKGWEYRDMSVTGKGRRSGTAARWKEILGMPSDHLATQHQLAEAIPPAYSEWIGGFAMLALS